MVTQVPPPDEDVRAAARRRSDAQAKPLAALGRLEELAAWVAACQGECPPRPLDRVRAVVLAGDHGVSRYGVSAYPREVTAAMLQAFVAGHAGVAVLARQHGVHLSVHDLGVDADLPAELSARVGRFKINRGSRPIHLGDALTESEVRAALAAGAAIAAEEIAPGCDLLVLGDMGIGNTTASAAVIAAGLGLSAEQVTGRGTGIDDATRTHKIDLVGQALTRAGDRVADPVQRLAALGSADLAAGAGCLVAAARARVPVLLDGVVALAEATVADDLAPGTVAWCRAGHRSTEPAQQLALEKLGLEPVLDLGMRLGEGSGAVAAVPVLRSAVLLLREMAVLSDLTLPDPSLPDLTLADPSAEG